MEKESVVRAFSGIETFGSYQGFSAMPRLQLIELRDLLPKVRIFM